MNFQDVSIANQYALHMQRIREKATRAANRKGEQPRDHPPPWLLIDDFLSAVEASNPELPQSQMHVTCLQVPAPYAPCTLPAADLKSITISEMKLETRHRGHKIVVRVLTPPAYEMAVLAVVEDEEGTAVILQLYHQPAEAVVPKDNILPKGGFVLIKEPFFKAVDTGSSYRIQADHVSDVIFLDDASDLIPKKWRKRKEVSILSRPSREIRLQGNKAVEKKEWATAERLYSASIQTAQTNEDDELAHLNRSLANLRLGRPASALSDAELGGKDKDAKPKEKVLFRKASALYELRKFDACLKILQDLEVAFPLNGAAKLMIDSVEARLREQENGEYSFGQMYKQARNTPPLIDCATYSAPVEIRASPGRGRGLFTTRKVSAGALLVCEKALGYSYAGEDHLTRTNILMNIATERTTIGGQANVLSQLVQKLYHDPEAARAFGELYHGDYETVEFSEVDGRPVIDTFLIERVIALAGFNCPRTTRAIMYGQDVDASDAFRSYGVWPLVSHINHACISNYQSSFIGDVQIVRATKDLEPGSELFFWYKSPVGYYTYEEAQKQLQNWDFTCACALCLARKKTAKTTINERKDLWTKIRGVTDDLMEGPMVASGKLRPANAKKVKKLLQQLEATYSSDERAPGAVRLELWSLYTEFGETLFRAGEFFEAIEMVVRGFEALGFIVTACPPRLNATLHESSAVFQVQQWGVAEESLAAGFSILYRAYKMAVPELAVVVKEYVETAYSIVVGEKDTILECHPELVFG